MTKDGKELQKQQIADFRYSVVGELCNSYMSKSERAELILEKAERSYSIPGSTRTKISEAAIRSWVSRCRKLGRDGLLPKLREDRGRPRSISDEAAQIITDRLEQHPELTAKSAVKQLLSEGKLSKPVTSSALSRFIRGNNLTRNERRKKKTTEERRRFSFEIPLECVQADAMHAFMVPDDSGIKRKAVLIAFIDDCTRRILYGKFHFSEKSIHFEDGIRHILLSHGKIGKLYTDNGSTFVSNQTRRITAILGVYLIHSRPYKPQGRGKIERFFRTVRDGFLRPLDKNSIKSLEQLNTRFTTWLEMEYHRGFHSSLGTTPLDAWLNKADKVKSINPDINLEQVFMHCEKRKIYNDSVFSLQGKIFEAPSVLAGKTVSIYFNPHLPVEKAFIKYEGFDYTEARPVNLYGNTKIKRHEYTRQLVPCEKQEITFSDNDTSTRRLL